MQPNTLNEFIESGKLPPTFKERSSLLGQARNLILNLSTNKTTPHQMIVFNKNNRHFQASTTAEFDVEAAKIKALSAEIRKDMKPAVKTPSVIHRSAHTAAAPVAAAVAPPTPGLITAANFEQSRPVMVKSEFDKLSASDKSRFFSEAKGQLVDDPEPAKPHTKNGQTTRAGFDAMTPAAKAAHCKAQLPIID